MMRSGVYSIRHIATGRRYIGSAVMLTRRWRRHLVDLRAGRHHSQKLQRAWNKYGSDEFVFEPLLICAPRDLLSYEEAAIAAFDGVSGGFNAAHRARSAAGVKRSPEFIAEIRARQLGRVRSLSEIEHLRKLARERSSNGLTQAARESIAAANRRTFAGVPLSEEHRAKLRIANKGKRPSTLAIERTRELRTGRPLSAETRLKMSAAQKGRTQSAETRAKISAAKMGHGVSPETLAKISSTKAMKRRNG